MLQLLYANTGKTKAFKKAMISLSSKLSDFGYDSFVDFNENFSVATIHLDKFKDSEFLGSTLTLVHSILSLISLHNHDYDCSYLYPDIVRFCKNV